MDRDLIFFKKIIETNGNKFTLQKQIILKTILEYQGHLNAKDIYGKVRDRSIGLATVYRNLKEFHELGILKELNVNGTKYYEMKIFSRKPLHMHLKCYKCDNIIDIDSRGLNLRYLKLNKIIEEKNDMEIYDIDIMFIGLCSKCKEEGKWQDQQDLEE